MNEVGNSIGLNSEEVKELIEYIDKNHSWKNMYTILKKNPEQKIIKYYSMVVDTRYGTVWQITFYNLINNGNINEVTFRTEKDYRLKDEVYKRLKSNNTE